MEDSDAVMFADILDILRDFSTGIDELEDLVSGLTLTRDDLVEALETLQARMVVVEE